MGFYRSNRVVQAEAIIAGRPGSTAHIELVSGVRIISQQEEHQPVWESWPRMSHLVQGCKEVDDPATTSNRANFPVKALLEKGTEPRTSLQYYMGRFHS